MSGQSVININKSPVDNQASIKHCHLFYMWINLSNSFSFTLFVIQCLCNSFITHLQTTSILTKTLFKSQQQNSNNLKQHWACRPYSTYSGRKKEVNPFGTIHIYEKFVSISRSTTVILTNHPLWYVCVFVLNTSFKHTKKVCEPLRLMTQTKANWSQKLSNLEANQWNWIVKQRIELIKEKEKEKDSSSQETSAGAKHATQKRVLRRLWIKNCWLA